MTSRVRNTDDMSGQIIDNTWYDNDVSNEDEEEYPIGEYDITSSPNDFNIITLFHFIDSGAIKIPGFQRNYVWDIKRASKLIESLLIGLPVPQVFLYEEARNSFLVIDGQQRLMSIYYFIKGKFPKKDKRTELRKIFDEHGNIPDSILLDNEYFSDFNLFLPSQLPDQTDKFHGLNYSTLGEYKTAFDLRTIRNIIVKQVAPKNDDSAIYEIFNRLNSGGVNLTPQEVRMSLYHSSFYNMLYRVNTREKWRNLVGLSEPDLHVKDLEFLLRGFAMLIKGGEYGSSMMRFLNAFSKDSKQYSPQQIAYLESLFDSFLDSCSHLSSDTFQSGLKRFSITLFESVFVAVCGKSYIGNQLVAGQIELESLSQLKADPVFLTAAEKATTSKSNVLARLQRAKEIIRVQ